MDASPREPRRYPGAVAVRFVIIGGGPAGNQAATYAARLGAEVVLVERDIVGGAAHLWDCIPSKTMIATGGAMLFFRRAEGMGLDVDAALDRDGLRSRVERIEARLHSSIVQLLTSQNVRIIKGTARLKGPHQVVVDTETGRRRARGRRDPAVDRLAAACAEPAQRRTASASSRRRDCYPPPQIPEHAVVIGSGVTGVEFVHMLSSLGSKVTLIVSRQQVLPTKDPEVAAALEADFLARRRAPQGTARGGHRCRRRRGRALRRRAPACAGLTCDLGDRLGAEHRGPRARGRGRRDRRGWLRPHQPPLRVERGAHLRGGDLSGKLPLSSVAAMQGRKIAEHVMGLHTREHRHLDYDKAASAIFTEPEIADVGLAEAEAFAEGRKIRVTKVPFSASAKALINNDPARVREDHL